jgi:hypothetical protein
MTTAAVLSESTSLLLGGRDVTNTSSSSVPTSAANGQHGSLVGSVQNDDGDTIEEDPEAGMLLTGFC